MGYPGNVASSADVEHLGRCAPENGREIRVAMSENQSPGIVVLQSASSK